MKRNTRRFIQRILGERISNFIRNYRMERSVKPGMDLKERASSLYRNILERELDLGNPQDINEKINWMKFNTDTSKWTELADKYKVRNFVKERGLEDILVKLYGKWDRADDIDFDGLTYPCMLKVNHGCGGNFFLDKKPSRMERGKLIRKINKILDTPFGYATAEPHYIPIKTCVLAEEMLKETTNTFPSSLVDYKVWCFDGEVDHIWATYNRVDTHVYVGCYDTDWRYHPEYSIFTSHYRDGGDRVPKPKALDKLIEAASTLSKGFPQVRIDFYIVNDKVYFGEMTFTGQGGYMEFYTPEYLKKMGDRVIL